MYQPVILFSFSKVETCSQLLGYKCYPLLRRPAILLDKTSLLILLDPYRFFPRNTIITGKSFFSRAASPLILHPKKDFYNSRIQIDTRKRTYML